MPAAELERQAALHVAARQGWAGDVPAGTGFPCAGRAQLPPPGPHSALHTGLAAQHEVAAPTGFGICLRAGLGYDAAGVATLCSLHRSVVPALAGASQLYVCLRKRASHLQLHLS